MGTFPTYGNIPKIRGQSSAMKRHQTTIVDIAKALNISKSTVSRALTNHPNINPDTKQKVLEIAEKLDYQKNFLSVSLVSKKTNSIGIIVPELMSSFFPKLINGVQTVANSKGYHLVICNSNENYLTEVDNTKIMLANQVDGLLVSITKETQNFDHLKIFQRKGIPLVFFNRICEDFEVPKVIVDDFEGAFRAVEHLIKRGKKRIAHLSGPPNLLICEQRLAGYKAALKKYNIPLIEELIIPYDLTIAKVKIYIKHLLSLENPPDAVFAINDPTAIEAIQQIKIMGLRIPEDVAVVGFSNDDVSALVDPPLTTVNQPVTEIGTTAAELVIDQIQKDPSEWKAFIKVLKTELLVRQTS